MHLAVYVCKTYHYLLQQDTNPLWPQFHDASPLEKTIYMPELVICLFATNSPVVIYIVVLFCQ